MSHEWSKEKMRAILRAFKDGAVNESVLINEIEQVIARRELNAIWWTYADALKSIDRTARQEHVFDRYQIEMYPKKAAKK